MITYYYRTIKNRRLQKLEAPRVGIWVHAEAPSGNEITHLCNTLGVDEEILLDALDPHEVPRVEVEKNATYVFTRVPQVHEGGDINTVPVLIAIGDTFVLTVALQHVASLDRFTSAAIEFYTTQKVRLFMQFFSVFVSTYQRRLTQIAKRVRAMNAADIVDARDITNFVETERVLNDYIFALAPTRRVLQRLLSGNVQRFNLHEHDADLVEDLLIDITQLEDMATLTLKNAVAVRTAHATIVSTNLNNTMKMLAALTVVLTVPTIISSFFGMNVPVPMASWHGGFPLIVAVTLSIVALVMWLFHRKRWF